MSPNFPALRLVLVWSVAYSLWILRWVRGGWRIGLRWGC